MQACTWLSALKQYFIAIGLIYKATKASGTLAACNMQWHQWQAMQLDGWAGWKCKATPLIAFCNLKSCLLINMIP